MMRSRLCGSRIAVSLALMLIFGVLSGCGHKQVRHGSSAMGHEAPITLEFWTLQLATFDGVINPLIETFEAAHPNVSVRWVDVPFSQGEKRTLTAMLSPKVPDVVNLNPDFAALLAARGTLLNMADALTTDQQADYVPAAWQVCTLMAINQGEQTSITVGLPWYLTSSIQIVNTRQAKGLGITQPPQSMAALLALATSPKVKGQYLTYPYIARSGGFLKSLYQHGLYAQGERLTEVLAKSEVKAFLSAWVSLYQQGLLPSESVTEGPQAAVDRYQSGNLLMFNTGANFLNIIQENAPDIYQHTAVYPQFPAATRHPVFSAMLLAVPKRSAHPKLAVAFAQHITSTAGQLALAKAAPVLPSTNGGLQQVANWTLPDEPALLTTARKQSAQQLLKATGAYPAIPNQKTIHEWADYYTQAALLGTMSVDDALAEMSRAIQPYQ